MSQQRNNYKDIADAIRAKKQSSNDMTPLEMPSEIESIPTGITPTGTLEITENGEGIDVTTYAAVDVAVPGGEVADYVPEYLGASLKTYYMDESVSGNIVREGAFEG